MTNKAFTRRGGGWGFSFLRGGKADDFFVGFDNPFGLGVREQEFVNAKLQGLYTRILSDCYTKSKGWLDDGKDEVSGVSKYEDSESDKIISSLWDNYVTSGDPQGTISLIAEAMTRMSDVYIVYESDTGLSRIANNAEKNTIKKDYETKGWSDVGIMVSFRRYNKTLVLKLYLTMLYGALGSAYTNLRIGQALKLKISKLREAISNMTSEDVIAQGRSIANALKRGQSVLLDKEDDIEVNNTNDGSVREIMTDFYSEIASELGVSLAYVKGELTTGMSVTGEADINYNENGIKNFFDSIFKPVCDALYDVDLSFVSDKRIYKVLQYATTLIAIENSDLLSPRFKAEIARWMGDEWAEEIDETETEVVEEAEENVDNVV